MRMHVVTVTLCVLALAPLLQGQEWTRFRGSNGTGVSDCTTIPVQWDEDQVLWRAELPGVGNSSPVLWGERIFTLSGDPDDATRYILCYSATDGRPLWQRKFPSQPHHLHTSNTYASSTPAVDADHVYVTWSTPDQTLLKALDHNGEEVWSRELGPFTSQNGYGASPIVIDDIVVLHHSQQSEQLEPGQRAGGSRMLALDRQTGRDVWQTPLKTGHVNYAVPFIYETQAGERQLVCAGGEHGVFGLDPTSGRELWSIEVFEMRVCSSPILAGGNILASNGSGAMSRNFIVGVKPGEQPALAFKLDNSRDFKAGYVPSMVAHGDTVFVVYDRGFVSSIDARSGQVNWCERTGGSFSGSPVLVDGRIYVVDEDGVVWVIAADAKEYRLLAKNPLGEGSRATPAIAGGRMFLRTASQLICVGQPTDGTARVGG